MHINMKYYVVTIGAIFIALGIGMLVGFNLNYDQELSKQQSTIIKDLDKKFENLKNKNDELEELLNSTEKNNNELLEYINTNYTKIIQQQLENKNIGVITTSQNYDYKEQVSNTIVNANGKVVFDIVLNESIINENKIKELSDTLEIDLKNSSDVINYIVECLNDVNANLKLADLESIGLIKINSIEPNYKDYTEVVIAGGNSKEDDDKAKLVDKILIDKLKEENKYVVAIEKSDVKVSHMDTYKESKIPTIDNIEEGLGKLSLVTVLKNQTLKGNFGRLEGVDGIIPFK